MTVKDDIITALNGAFQVTDLQVVNESAQHAGHSGDDRTGESHFAIRLRAPVLDEMGWVARHRAVHAALGGLNQRVHAIALDLG